MKKDTMTAVSKEDNKLKLPILHILVKEDRGLIIGHCLDFNIHAHSNSLNFEQAKKEVFIKICEMSLLKILRHLMDGNIDNLYKNSVPLNKEWEDYMEVSRKKRIENLKTSYDLIKEATKEVAKNINDFQEKLELKKFLIKNPFNSVEVLNAA